MFGCDEVAAFLHEFETAHSHDAADVEAGGGAGLVNGSGGVAFATGDGSDQRNAYFSSLTTWAGATGQAPARLPAASTQTLS
jgi:hypothetical protein